MKIIDKLAHYFSTNLHECDFDFKIILTEIVSLIQEGADVNATDEVGLSPLHIATNYSMINVAHALIEAGSDINAQESILGFAPLHYAIKAVSKETMCMLLSYGADVSIANCLGMTPLMLAIKADLITMARILLDYYDDFSHTDEDGFTALSLATRTQNPIAIDLVLAGADVNCVKDLISNPLPYSLMYEDAKLFKLVWYKMDHNFLLEIEIPFLFIYFHDCRFSTLEWLECLYLLLESKPAFLLIEQVLDFGYPSSTVKYALFANLLHAFHTKNIPQDDRIAIIQICLSLGAEVDFNDIITAYNLYGFNEEIRAFIYVYDNHGNIKNSNFLLPTFMFTLEHNYNTENIFESLAKQLMYCYNRPGINLNERNMIQTLGYFALPINYKKKLLRKIHDTDPINQSICIKLTKKLKKIPEIASLLELSRNQARKFIKEFYKIKKTYQFYDAVKNLCLPEVVKDLILFKVPVYYEVTILDSKLIL